MPKVPHGSNKHPQMLWGFLMCLSYIFTLHIGLVIVFTYFLSSKVLGVVFISQRHCSFCNFM